MYCGPNIPGVAAPGLIFTTPPPLLQEHMDKCHALKALVVEPKEFARVKQAASRTGTLEHTQYQKARAYLSGGGGKA
jgi:hypothetical protein